MDQRVENLRGFFIAFFSLSQPVWSGNRLNCLVTKPSINILHERLGFLAGWPGLPNNEYHDRWDRRLRFALELFVKMPAVVAFTMVHI